eukprot:6640069-Prymnesium_polylepis.1
MLPESTLGTCQSQARTLRAGAGKGAGTLGRCSIILKSSVSTIKQWPRYIIHWANTRGICGCPIWDLLCVAAP